MPKMQFRLSEGMHSTPAPRVGNRHAPALPTAQLRGLTRFKGVVTSTGCRTGSPDHPTVTMCARCVILGRHKPTCASHTSHGHGAPGLIGECAKQRPGWIRGGGSRRAKTGQASPLPHTPQTRPQPSTPGRWSMGKRVMGRRGGGGRWVRFAEAAPLVPDTLMGGHRG